jgi:hypothetical protein
VLDTVHNTLPSARQGNSPVGMTSIKETTLKEL